MKVRTAIVKVISGDLYNYLKDVRLWGAINPDKFTIYGCVREDETKFYNGIFEYDKATDIQGFKSAKEVKIWWEEVGDMSLIVENGDYKEIQTQEIKSGGSNG